MVLINAKIFTMSDYGIIENGFVKIDGNKISQVGQMSEFMQCDEQVVDLKGMTLTPGFIDAHTHLGVCEEGIGFEGDDCNEETDPITPQLRAIDATNPMDMAFRESLEAGVTSVLTCPGSANPLGGQIAAIKTYGKRIDDMIIKAPIAFKFALGENPKIVYHDKNQAPMTRMATASLIREALFKAKEYMNNIDDAKNNENNESNENEDEDSTPDFDIKLDSMLPLMRGEVPAHFHAHRADDIFTAIRISKEFGIKYVIVHATEAHMIAEELKKENTKVICGPVLSDKVKPELINQSVKGLKIIDEAGLTMSICTDHPVFPLKYLTTCAAIAVREGLDEIQALKAITINSAIISGIDDSVGSIEAGKDADIVIMDGEPLDYRTKVVNVVAGGKMIKAM